MEFVVDKLIDFSAGKDEELRDISGLGACLLVRSLSQGSLGNTALKTITSELPPEGKIATKACEKLTPKLLGQVANVCHHPLLISYMLRFVTLLSRIHHLRP